VAKGYNLLIEGLAISFKRLMKNQLIPMIKETITDGEMLRITGDPVELRKLDDDLVRNYVYSQVENYRMNMGIYPQMTDMDMEMEIERVKQELSKMGEDRFLEVRKDLFNDDYDIDVEIGDESLNKAFMAQSLGQMLSVLASSGLPVKDVLRELFDTMGLDAEKLVGDMQTQPALAPQVSPTGEAPVTQAVPMEGQISPVPASPNA
jgi:hypothetical protein